MSDICEKCGCELRVVGSRYEIDENGEDTKLFSVVEVMCINPQCADFEIKREIKNELAIGGVSGTGA